MQACNFPGAEPLGVPRDWDTELDGEVGTIFVANAVDTLSGMNVMYSVYKPSADEIAALLNGGAIRLGIMGRSHPVFQLAVLTPETCERAELTPVWDLGGVVGNG